MSLLAQMVALQEAHGAVTDADLRTLSREAGVPLHRLQGLRSFYPQFSSAPARVPTIAVCRDVVCRMRGGSALDRYLEGDGARDGNMVPVSCLGRCDRAPAALIDERPHQLRFEDAGGDTGSPQAEPLLPAAVRPWGIDPYTEAKSHYGTLREWLARGDVDALIDTLKESGLKGMGGAGFPAGVKWEACRKAEHPVRAVVCNADESEPGTFKDRTILAELPHLVIEGMLLAAWACNAREGIIYLRHEYEPERHALEQALQDARARGTLGANALGPGRAFDIRVFVSPGGYILGEETALLEALEDRRGEPRNKPPFPVTHGLEGQPTLLNNVETLAASVSILHHGADWWHRQGRNGGSGLKLLAVSGDVEQPDVYCVPMGTTARELLEAAGGMRDGAQPLAFFPGGASTNPLPAAALDTPMDWEALREEGSALGSGAVTFVAEGRNLLELVLAQVRFFRNESCGKCVPCRVGSHKAVEMVEAALAGAPEAGLPETLRRLDGTLARTSICGLGQVALAPLVALMDRFPRETWQVLAGGEETR